MNKSKKAIKEFTLNELHAIESSIVIFRSCMDIPFAIANEINGNVSPIKAAINKFQDKLTVLRERNTELEKDKDKDPEKYNSATELNNNELVKIFSDKIKVELSPVNMSSLSKLEINGDKEVRQQDGSQVKLSYRDAFFYLQEVGVII